MTTKNDPNPVDLNLYDLLKEIQAGLFEDTLAILKAAKDNKSFLDAPTRQAIAKLLKDNGMCLALDELRGEKPKPMDLPEFDD